MSGPYTREKDPFILFDLSQPSPVRDYARRYYNQARGRLHALGGRQQCAAAQSRVHALLSGQAVCHRMR